MRGVGGLPSGITFGGPVTRNAEIDPPPPPKMTQGVMTPYPPLYRLSTASLNGVVSILYHRYFRFFLSEVNWLSWIRYF